MSSGINVRFCAYCAHFPGIGTIPHQTAVVVSQSETCEIFFFVVNTQSIISLGLLECDAMLLILCIGIFTGHTFLPEFSWLMVAPFCLLFWFYMKYFALRYVRREFSVYE